MYLDAYNSETKNCYKYLNHIKFNICNGDMERYNYLLNWMAMLLQEKDHFLSSRIAILLQGEKGIGKSFFVDQFGKILGNRYFYARKASYLSKMNNIVLCLSCENNGDFYNDSDKSVSPCHLVFESNQEQLSHEWLFNRLKFDTNLLPLQVSSEYKNNYYYFSDILNQLKNGGYNELEKFFKSRDLSGFDVLKIQQFIQ